MQTSVSIVRRKRRCTGLTQAIAEEVWQDGIIANVLIPGPVRTELSKPAWENAGTFRAQSDPWKEPETGCGIGTFSSRHNPLRAA